MEKKSVLIFSLLLPRLFPTPEFATLTTVAVVDELVGFDGGRE